LLYENPGSENIAAARNGSHLRGQPVQLPSRCCAEGLGTYTPSVDLSGKIGVGHRADTYINGSHISGYHRDHLQASGAFKGERELSTKGIKFLFLFLVKWR
jgi:hypothetical protein